MSKVFKYGLLVVFIIFLILLLVPWLFKDEIFKRVKEEANNNLKGELVIEDLSLSLIRDFPNLLLSLEGLKYTGTDQFDGQELFNIEQVRASLDIMSVITGETIKVNEIAVVDANIHTEILEDGTPNYDIMKPSEEPVEEEAEVQEAPAEAEGESGGFNLGIDRFLIEDMNVVYDDKQGGIYSKIEDFDLELTGNFSADEVINLVAESSIDELTVAMDGMNYLNAVEVDVELDAGYELATEKLTLGKNKVALNALELLFHGWVQTAGDNINLDLDFSAPHTAFKEVLSLVPAVYMTDFDDVETTGKFTLTGDVKGTYNGETENYPQFDLNLDVVDARFQYPDLPASVEQINISTRIAHPQGVLDLMVIDVDPASLSLANNPFEARIKIDHPMTDPAIDAALKAVIDFDRLEEVVPVQGTDMAGKLYADAFVKGSMSQFENEDYAAVKAGGFFSLDHFRVLTEAYKEPVIIDTTFVEVTAQKLNLPILTMHIGESDFNGSGSLKNMLGYALADDTISGKFKLSSSYINVTQLMGAMVDETASAEQQDHENNSTATDEKTSDSTAIAEVPTIPGNIELAVKARAKKVSYNELEMTNLVGDLEIVESEARLKNVNMNILKGKMKMDGVYSTPNNLPFVDANFAMTNVDAKQAFTDLNTVQRFAPVAQSTTGSVSIKLAYQGVLNADLTPNLSSVQAEGDLKTIALSMQPEIMKTVAGLLNNSTYEKIRLEDADLSFKIKDGRIKVSPSKLFVGDVKAEFAGSHGLDNTMDYNIKTDVPLDNIDLPQGLKDLGLTAGTIPVTLKIGGTFDKPTVKPVFGQATGVKDIVNTVVDKAVKEAKDSVVNVINKEAEKLLADAQKEADELMRQAVEEAAKLKAEASKQADDLKKEARKQADKLLEEAKGDVFKEAAAKIAADKLIEQADKQIDTLESEAAKQADNLVVEAQKQADLLIKEAEEKAKIKN